MNTTKSLLLLALLFLGTALNLTAQSDVSTTEVHHYPSSEETLATTVADPDACFCKYVLWSKDSTSVTIYNVTQLAKDAVGSPNPGWSNVKGCYKNVHSGWQCDECTFTRRGGSPGNYVYKDYKGVCSKGSVSTSGTGTSFPPTEKR